MWRTSLILAMCGVLMTVSDRGTTAPGFPSYTRSLQLEASSDASANVSIGDVNGDGKLDLVLIKGRHWPGMSRVMLGDGHGHFPTAYDLSDTQYRSYSGNLVDLNGDGALDIVLSNDRPDPKVILLNDGKGHFHRASTFGDSIWDTRNVAIADLDGDGRIDLVVPARDGTQSYVYINTGKATFPESSRIPFGLSDASVRMAAVADLDGDGRKDIVVIE